MTRIVRPRIIPKQIADAGEQAQAILARAEELAQARHARAIEEGRAEGRAELAKEWLALDQQRVQLLQAIEEQAICVAMLASKRILRDELTLHPEQISHVVRELLTRVRRAKQITLRVHPDDVAALERLLLEWSKDSALSASTRIEADPAQDRGGCLLISELGTLDARVETQLQALSRALGTQ